MIYQKKHFSVWLILNLSRIAFWGILASSIFVLIICLLKLSIPRFNDISLDIGLPINFELVERGTFDFNGEKFGVQYNQTSGIIHFERTPKTITFMIVLFSIPLMFLILLGLSVFNNFLKNVNRGNVFKPENIWLLKKISYIILIMWAYRGLFAIIVNLWFATKFEFYCIKPHFVIGFPGVMLWLSLFIWVLSHIFQKGAEIEEENSLTI